MQKRFQMESQQKTCTKRSQITRSNSSSTNLRTTLNKHQAKAIADGAVPGTPNMDHLHSYAKALADAGLDRGVLSPMILPNYATDEIRKQRWDVPSPVI